MLFLFGKDAPIYFAFVYEAILRYLTNQSRLCVKRLSTFPRFILSLACTPISCSAIERAVMIE